MSELEQLDKIIARIVSRKESAYINYIAKCRQDECLGFDAKVENGKFGRDELQAHNDAHEMLGRHRAFADVLGMFLEPTKEKDIKLIELKNISTVYSYAAASMCPETFEKFEQSIRRMCENRRINYDEVVMINQYN